MPLSGTANGAGTASDGTVGTARMPGIAAAAAAAAAALSSRGAAAFSSILLVLNLPPAAARLVTEEPVCSQGRPTCNTTTPPN